jgi:uncharacterized protein YbbC (DUF1343 family)
MSQPPGLDELCAAAFAPVRGKRVGLVSHPAAVDWQLVSAAERFADTDACHLVRLFGPEHGFAGAAQDLEGVAEDDRPHPRFGVPVVSLYGDTVESLKPTAAHLADLDVLVIDMVDIGSRYYTFQATMLYCLEAAAEIGLPVVVLDRDNPIGLTDVEGPTVRPGFESFVGVHPIAIRHGLTMGELATLYKAERVPAVDLSVIRVARLEREPTEFYLPPAWVSPSPNMPSQTTADLYPGLCLIEGTNLSEGRGTCRPFELVGHPKLDPWQAAKALNDEAIPGIRFLPATFTPKSQKHANELCGGVQLVVTDSDDFKPVRTGLALIAVLRQLLGEHFHWRTETYEFVSRVPAIDLLFGSDRERLAVEAGVPWREIAVAWELEEADFRRRREAAFLYR